MKSKAYLFLLLLAGVSSGMDLFAQTYPRNNDPLKTKLDSAVQKAAAAYFQDGTAHGLIIGIVKHGKQSFYCFGESRIGVKQLPSADAYFNLGSVAKTFVATLLAQAVIEKRAALTDDIRRYLPASYPYMEYRGRPVRLVDLANHTSGLPETFRTFPRTVTDSVRRLSFIEQAHFFNQYEKAMLVQDLHSIRPDTLPGTKFRYNSSAYSLLIFILENIYHQSFNELCSTYLKTHLKLYHTRQVLPAKAFAQTMQGYNDHDQPMPFLNLTGYFLGPSMNTTATDLLSYVAAQLAEKDPAVRLTHQLTYGNKNGFALGLGWMIDTENGVRYYYHDGNTKLGYNTLCTFYPAKDFGIVLIANDVRSLQKLGKAENSIADQLK